LTAKSVGVYREVFRLFDSDGNGAVDIDELHSGMNQAKEISLMELQQMVDKVDEEHTGDLNFANFCELMLIMGDENQSSSADMDTEVGTVRTLNGQTKLVV
jgi:calmodulin